MADRSSLSWSDNVFEYLELVPHPGKVIGCMISAGPILTNSMRKYADAILLNIFPGQQYSNAILNIIFGRANPSAKLSFTMPNIDNEQKMSESQYPGSDNHHNSTYTEQHHFGYRWYDQNDVQPAYEFGFGLSYTTFSFSDLSLKDKTISFKVSNTGSVKGSEVAQIYVGFPETENLYGGYRSPKVLKGFVKVKDLQPGESREVNYTFKDEHFSFWDVNSASWKIDAGEYKIMVGSSSRDIRLNTVIELS